MRTIPDLSYYTRMSKAVWGLIREGPVTNPAARLQRQMAVREQEFLETINRVVFADPAHPYRHMFRAAGCEYADLEREVLSRGLESTLAQLHRDGVYLAHDEFKGRKPIVRGGRHIPSTPASFRNPLARGGVESRSSGSRSSRTTTTKSASHGRHSDCYHAVFDAEMGLGRRTQVLVKMILPAGDGLKGAIRLTRAGARVGAWFSPAGAERDSTHYRWATNCFVLLARAYGHPVPFPRYLPRNDFSSVAECVAQIRANGDDCVVRCQISPAVRIVAAARERGFDISGTIFTGGGEALTEYKRTAVETSGARIFPRYSISEIGSIGYSCSKMRQGNCVHLFHDSVAVISHKRVAPLSEVEVDSLLFTTLLRTAPHIFVNVEMDDSGIIEPATCDCSFSRLGFTTQIRGIFSYGKLTGQGVTLVGTDVVRILEVVLPERFGGAPTDYQLVEAEGASQTSLCLRVSPRIALGSTDDVRDSFLNGIRQFVGGAGASRVWKQSEALEVIRAEPLVSGSGKVLSLHLLRRGDEP